MPENWILCPLHNALPLTQPAVESFLAQDILGGVRVLLINNGSDDNTAHWLASLTDERITSIHIVPQRGVAHAWNYGLRYILQRDSGGRALVVNSDVVLRPDTYRLLDRDGGEFVTAVGSDDPKAVAEPPQLVYYHNSPPYVPMDGSEPVRGVYFVDPATRRPHPDFSCFLIRDSVIEAVGEFDERFRGAYCEDGDFHLRVHQAGISAYSIGLAFLHVDRGSGSMKALDDVGKHLAAEQAARNREYFRSKWGVEMGTEEYYALFR